MEREGLTQFVFDFRDGRGPVTFYGRRLSARERVQIEAIRKTRVETVDGKQIETVTNPTETLTHALLIRARDAIGGRMWSGPAETAHVWENFDPAQITAAILALNELDADPGNG